MISYELAKQLKDKGFKQRGRGTFISPETNEYYYDIRQEAYIPTLSELIDAVKEKVRPHWQKGFNLKGYWCHDYCYIASVYYQDYPDGECKKFEASGLDADEAVSNLWLELNKGEWVCECGEKADRGEHICDEVVKKCDKILED